jgi:acyl-CoA thioester hydrolase
VAWGDFRHRVPLRVRWAEVDRQGVVFNAHYLLYCDVCVTEYWRAVGLRYPDDFEPLGTDLYVRRATVDYRAAALYDDELDVCGRIARLGGSSLHFAVELYRRAQTASALVACDLVYVYVDVGTKAPRRIDDAVRAHIRAFETVAPDESSGNPR